jgi:sarcosine oxidase subunit beta
VPALAGVRLAGSRVGFDGYTPDKRPAIGWHGPVGLYACTGFSGGGIKVAPAVADLVAEEIISGSPVAALAPYRPGRFAAGDLIESEFPYGHL